MKVTLLHFGLLAMLASPSAAFSTQDADESALDALDNAPKPPPPKIEPAGAAELRDAVRRIAQRPTDSFALTDAGYAAITLGDYDAAFNFFTKAGALQPMDARIKAGLAIAQVRRENPFEALSLFDEALRLGASERSIALDRALAYDLLGNFERAERDYALATSFDSSEEARLRHAISLSLAGRRDEADRMLIPMLQKEDPEAWRARAMMLAARGDHKEASKIALGFLSDSEARRMDGYFRNMPRLTGAQQAAAMHFGNFPLGSDIGEDSNSVRTLAAATGAKPVPPSGDSRLVPTGEPLGTKPGSAKTDKPKKPAIGSEKRSPGIKTASAQEAIDAASRAKVTTIPASRLPAPEAARPPVRITLPALAKPTPWATELPATGPAVIATGGPRDAVPVDPAPQPTPAIVKSEPVQFTVIDPAIVIASETPPQPGFESLPTIPNDTRVVAETKVETPFIGPVLDEPPATQVAAVIPQPEPVAIKSAQEPAPAPEKTFDLGALVASIEVPDAEKNPSTVPVDLKKIKTTAPVAVTPKPDPKAAKTAAAAPRIWVQIATGADANGLGYDFKRMAKKAPALFANREGWVAVWNKTRRLLVGPFPDLKSAKKWEADFRKSGGEGFVWQSDKTAQIDKLKGK